MKPQYEIWSASKITEVKVTGPIETESFANAKFKVVRGYVSQVHEFTLADLPCLNPYGWIMLYNLFLRDRQKYELSYLELMIVSYIQEVGKWMWHGNEMMHTFIRPISFYLKNICTPPLA
ncbi:unnamed protein product [Lactuca saligna]|uniref:Uncharacterized protein n=1 Tax=Lactuca saligna TaxID=75948 RepID=A0AA35ZL86_LACSI|nr:unnamed protein product [Lactuca saligna]